MLETNRITEIASEAAISVIGKNNVLDVFSELTSDSTGHEAIQVTIVIERLVDGETALNTLVTVQDLLQRNHEERLVMVGYATEDELRTTEPDDDVDPEL